MANSLSNYLVEQILLGEAVGVKNVVVVYAGRFQPFHKGHYATYSHLVKKFGKDSVFVGTSNKTDNQKSPFNFKEKKQIMTTMFGIPSSKIIEVKNPYKPTEILGKFNEDTTAFVTVVGEKDEARLGGNYFQKWKDGNELEGYRDRGYVYISPAQPNALSGTDVRNNLGKNVDDNTKLDFFSKRAYPKFDKKIYTLITSKLSESVEPISISKEVIEEWVISKFPQFMMEVSQGLGLPTGKDVDDGPNFFFPNYDVFNTISQRRAEHIGYTLFKQITDKKYEDYYEHPIYPNGPVKAVTPFPAGVIGKTTATNQKDIKTPKAYDMWFKHVTRAMALAGYSLVRDKDEIEKKLATRDLPSYVEMLKDKDPIITPSDRVDEGLGLAMGYPSEEQLKQKMDQLKKLRIQLDKHQTGDEEYTPIKEDKIEGGLSAGMSLEDIANHHKVDIDELMGEFQMGVKVEMEHTTDREVAREIAMDHLYENPKYYTKLSTIEKNEYGFMDGRHKQSAAQIGGLGDSEYSEYVDEETLNENVIANILIKLIAYAGTIVVRTFLGVFIDRVIDGAMRTYQDVKDIVAPEPYIKFLKGLEKNDTFNKQFIQFAIQNRKGNTLIGNSWIEKVTSLPAFVEAFDKFTKEEGIEGMNKSNLLRKISKSMWDTYLRNWRGVYAALKKKYPQLANELPEGKLNEFNGFRFDAIGYDKDGKQVDMYLPRARFGFEKNVVHAAADRLFKTGISKGNGIKYIEIYYNKHHLGTIRLPRNFTKGKDWDKLPINEIPMADLVKIDQYADKQLNPFDVVLTDKHFFDRLQDPRNKKDISPAELIGFFKRLGKNKKKFVEFLNQYNQIVAKDNRTKINIPFMKQANKVIAKTIMRKDDFKTPSPEYKFEALAVAGGKVHKFITGKNLTLKGKKYPDIEFEVLSIDNKSQLVKLKVLAPKGLFGQEMNVPFKTIRRGPFIKTDTNVFENINLPVKVGDTILMGKFKNKKVVVKDIGKDEYGMPTINGKKVATFRTIKEGLLLEGGAYGHMNHPFDTEINLTFGQLKDIVNRALDGELELAREKTDGQALAISWVNGKLVAARNKGHLANRGANALDVKGVATKFAGRGELEKAYNFAMNDLEKAVKSLSEKQREKIFKDGACFMNLEVIYPTSVNVIPYGQALLVFHGTMEYNEKGEAIGENQQAARILAGMIKQVNQNVQSTYTIQGPPVTKLPKSQKLSSLKGKYNGKITKLQSQFGLSDNAGIAEYHQAWWTDFIQKKSPTAVDNNTLIGLVKRWAFYDKGFRLDSKNISDPKVLAWAQKIDKEDHAKIAKNNIRPFEDIFLGVGAEVLSFMSSVLAANPDAAVRNMKDRLDKMVVDVQKTGDPKLINKLKLELQRLNSIGGKEKIVPNEGIVFVYNGNTMKLTGTFAPLNQILGMFYGN
jgi:hypothetical protein